MQLNLCYCVRACLRLFFASTASQFAFFSFSPAKSYFHLYHFGFMNEKKTMRTTATVMTTTGFIKRRVHRKSDRVLFYDHKRDDSFSVREYVSFSSCDQPNLSSPNKLLWFKYTHCSVHIEPNLLLLTLLRQFQVRWRFEFFRSVLWRFEFFSPTEIRFVRIKYASD